MQELLIPFITIVVQGIKKTGKVGNEWLPLLAVAIGAIVGYAAERGIEGPIRGAIAGGAAVGLYEVVKGGSVTVKKMIM